jgi:hypothetical protein
LSFVAISFRTPGEIKKHTRERLRLNPGMTHGPYPAKEKSGCCRLDKVSGNSGSDAELD